MVVLPNYRTGMLGFFCLGNDKATLEKNYHAREKVASAETIVSNKKIREGIFSYKNKSLINVENSDKTKLLLLLVFTQQTIVSARGNFIIYIGSWNIEY